MDFSTKKYYKKMARMYFTLAWVLAITWILYIIISCVIIIVTPHLNASTLDDHSFLIFSVLLFPLITSVVLGYIGQEYTNKRIKYKRQINEYRQRKFFTQIIDLLRRGNITDGVIMYNKLLKDDTFRNFIFPFIICESIHSIEDDRREIGNKKLNDILANFNPDKIIFQV